MVLVSKKCFNTLKLTFQLDQLREIHFEVQLIAKQQGLIKTPEAQSSLILAFEISSSSSSNLDALVSSIETLRLDTKSHLKIIDETLQESI